MRASYRTRDSLAIPRRASFPAELLVDSSSWQVCSISAVILLRFLVHDAHRLCTGVLATLSVALVTESVSAAPIRIDRYHLFQHDSV
jgi:hypothetical protein